MKTLWLSFSDPDRQPGEQFLGVAIIDVTDLDAAEARAYLRVHRPQAQPDAEWILAAIRKAHRFGCNPGGQVLSSEIPHDAPGPRGVLMDREELSRRKLAGQ
jgi:hypothetical protein